MLRVLLIGLALGVTAVLSAAPRPDTEYGRLYDESLARLRAGQGALLAAIEASDPSSAPGRDSIRAGIAAARARLKAADFWLRYLDPIAYRRLHGPLPVEWEVEVFEKFEPPYRREGAGLILAEQYLDEESAGRDSLRRLIGASLEALAVFEADSTRRHLGAPGPFFLANRLFLLNLAALYTTGFECPDPSRVVPELREMLAAVRGIYDAYDRSFPATRLSGAYRAAFDSAIAFAAAQPDDATAFDHFSFIRDHVNRLFAMNQGFLRDHGIASRSANDYSLSHEASSIFDKDLFSAQNTLGVYSLIEDPAVLERIRQVGRLLFHDPIVSGNDSRSCASCHKPEQAFTDTQVPTALAFDGRTRLPRNAPSLINVVHNHLVMLDGKHLALDEQARAVIANPAELNGSAAALLAKVMSCPDYRREFRSFARLVPEERAVTIDHVVSALTYYYGGFSRQISPFDDAMNGGALPDAARRGFNLFMSKAQCGTCHFVPQFNGVKPPYVGSEFEVLGSPADSANREPSPDPGRHAIHPVPEMLRAFRTPTVRNVERTAPYMHNGAYRSLDQVIDFYDAGGGLGLGLDVPNQTLPADSLRLTPAEKQDLRAFLRSLNEAFVPEAPPTRLPASTNPRLDRRRVGGDY